MSAEIKCLAYLDNCVVTSNAFSDVYVWSLPEFICVHKYKNVKNCPIHISAIKIGDKNFFLSQWGKNKFDLIFMSKKFLMNPQLVEKGMTTDSVKDGRVGRGQSGHNLPP